MARNLPQLTQGHRQTQQALPEPTQGVPGTSTQPLWGTPPSTGSLTDPTRLHPPGFPPEGAHLPAQGEPGLPEHPSQRLRRHPPARNRQSPPTRRTNRRSKTSGQTPPEIRRKVPYPHHPLTRQPDHLPTKHLGLPKLKIKGLPAIRLKSSRILPLDQQPSTVHITLKGGQIHLRLVHDQTPHPGHQRTKSDRPGPGPRHRPDHSHLNHLPLPQRAIPHPTDPAQQRLQKAIAAAIRLGHCGFKAVLDEHNQVLSSRDKPRRELVWLKTPTKSYLRARETLTDLRATQYPQTRLQT